MTDNRTTVLFTSGNGENPYHSLLFKHLEQHGVTPVNDDGHLFLPLTRSVLRNDNIDIVHLGWLYRFYLVRDYTNSSIVNTVITLGRALWFCIDLLLIKLIGIQLVWTVHNKYHHERYYHRTETLLNIFVANLVNDITVKCESARETIISLYRIQDRSKIAVIPDGNYTNAYPNTMSKEEAQEQLGIESEFVYLFFGKIRPYKGVNTLIKEFQEIDDDECSLWIVGNPIGEAISEQVRLSVKQDDRIETRLEFIPTDEVQLYMNAADVLVLPYKDILNSGSVHLGLSFGVPIIAPQLGCIPETAPDSNLLYDAQDSALSTILAEAQNIDLERIKDENINQARLFRWEKASTSYSKIYNNNT